MKISNIIDEILKDETFKCFEGPDKKWRTTPWKYTLLKDLPRLAKYFPDIKNDKANMDCIFQLLLTKYESDEFDPEDFSTFVNLMEKNANQIKYEDEDEVCFITESPFDFWSKNCVIPIGKKELNYWKNALKNSYPDDWKYRLIPISKFENWQRFHPCQNFFDTITYVNMYEDDLTEEEKKEVSKFEFKLFEWENY